MKGRGEIEADSFAAPIAIPDSLGGSGEGTDPKTLLLSSAASCYLLTLVAILQNRKLPVAGLTLASQVSEIEEAGLTIEHQVRAALPSGATDEQVQAANSAFEAADRACAIGNILKKAGAQISIGGLVQILEPAEA